MRGIKRFKSIIQLFKGQNLGEDLSNEIQIFPPNQDSLFWKEEISKIWQR